MGVDVNDLKILINASFQYLMKTCHQWAKDHPLVTGVLLFFYLLYIFFPNLFDILFYTFPLIICIAIILGGKHISSKQNQEQIKNNKKYDVLRSMSIDHRRRRHLTPQMRSMTLGRTDGLFSHDEIKDNHTNTKLINDQISASASCTALENPTLEQTSRQTSTGISSHSDTESPDEEENEDGEARQARDKVVEWTEDDQRNLMDLGTSEIERNKRLESLIAKRRARKQLSMQPRRAHYPYENLMDQVGTIMVSRCIDHDAEHQPGSAPCVLRPSRNPFDLPYDPHEEKPVLTGGSFDDEFFSNEQKEMLEECLNKHDASAADAMDDMKFLPSFFSKPKSVDKPGFTRFRRGSEESMKDNLEELSKEDSRNDQDQNQQDSSEEDQTRSSLSLPKEEHHGLENPFAKDFDTSKSDSTSSSEMINKDDLQTKDDNNKDNILHMNSEETITPVEVQSSVQDHVSVNNDRDDDQDSTTSSSSSSTEMTINAIKNEAFRNSVKKVLNCLVIQRHKANAAQGNTYDNATTSNGLLFDSVPNVTTPTKMDERSFYTSRSHHTTTFSIASDMQVEVSDTGSPPLATLLDPGSPTDRESLVYDADVDKDANSGDEDLWDASPHPTRQGDFATKFKLPDITEEGHDVKGPSFRDENRTAEERTSPTQGKEIDQDQRSIDAEIVGSVSSGSSSSDGLMSQMQAKSEHLAEYLANLPPTQSGPNALEGPEPSLVRESSAEELALLGLDEAKDESKGIEEMAESSQQRNGEQSIVMGKAGAENRIGSISREFIEGEPDNHQARIIEQDEPRLLEENDHELERNMNESYFSEPVGHEKEVVISDSLSTTCQEEILEQSRFDEGGTEPSLVRKSSAEEHTLSALDEAKDESKKIKEMAESFQQGNGEQSIVMGEARAENQIGSISREFIEGELHNHQARIIEQDELRLLEENDHELERNMNESYFSEPVGNEKEVMISDSLSTTRQEEILEQSRFDEGGAKPSLFRENSTEEQTLLALDEAKDEPKGIEEIVESSQQGSGEHNIVKGEAGAENEIGLISRKSIEGESTADEPRLLLEENDHELGRNLNESYFSEPVGHEKADSLSTTCQEEILEQSRFDEGGTEPFLVKENSKEEHTLLASDEAKDESKGIKEMTESSQQESGEHNIVKSEARAENEIGSISRESTEGELDNHQAKIVEDEPKLLEENDHELKRNMNESYFSEPVRHEKEVMISDSLSTTSQEEILEQSRSDKGGIEPSLVRESSAEEQALLGLDESKDESKGFEEMAESSQQGSGKQIIVKGEAGSENEIGSISREYIEGKLDNHQERINEDEPRLLEENDHESERNINESYFSEPVGHETEVVISDSLSTPSQQEILEQSRYDEGNTKKLDEHTMISNDGEVKEDSVDDPVIHDEPRLLEESDHELERNTNESDFSEPLGHEKKVNISDSFSTTCPEEMLEQSRFDEGGTGKLDEHMMISNDGGVKEDSTDDHVIHDESTFVGKREDDQANDGLNSDENALKLDEQSMTSEVKSSIAEVDTPQTATIEDDNMHSLNSTGEAVSSGPIINDSQDNLDHNVH